MKTKEELKKYYEEQLLNELKGLDGKRKKTLLYLVGYTILAGFAALLLAAIMLVSIYLLQGTCALCGGIGVPILLVVLFGFWVYGLSRIKRGYTKDFKTNVVLKVVKFIDEGLEYAPGKSISSSDYHKSKIFLSHVDIYSGEDYVFGTVGKTKVEFSEVHTQEKHETTDSKGHRHTYYTTIFKGVFFIADFNKNFKGATLVLPDTAEKTFGKMLGGFLQSKNIGRPTLVKLEDPEFEKLFVVYGEDQIEARYILSTSLMQRITEFRKKSNRSIYLSFVENKVMIAVPSGKDLFEPRLFRSIVDYGQIEDYYNDLAFVVGIVEDLNLNTRIWGK